MSRKVYINVTTRVIVDMEEGLDVRDVISDMEYHFASTTEGADIVDTEITGHEVMDSK